MNTLQEEILADLESGEYTQAFGVLRAGPTCFCAEGIIANVLVRHGFGKWYGNSFYYQSDGSPGRQSRVLPSHVDGVDFKLRGPEGYPIYSLNDHDRLTFPQIAEQLRKFWVKGETDESTST